MTMQMIYDHPTERTLLSPLTTAFRIEVFLEDITHLYDAIETDSGYEYRFTAHPYTYQDQQTIIDVLEQAEYFIETNKDSWSRKVADSSSCFNSKGELVFSQLFTPKVQTGLEQWEIRGKQASIAGHLREDPTGKIFLQASYCDIYDNPTGIDAYEYHQTAGANPHPAAAPVVEDDW